MSHIQHQKTVLLYVIQIKFPALVVTVAIRTLGFWYLEPQNFQTWKM